MRSLLRMNSTTQENIQLIAARLNVYVSQFLSEFPNAPEHTIDSGDVFDLSGFRSSRSNLVAGLKIAIEQARVELEQEVA
jgi:hypothetical protein